MIRKDLQSEKYGRKTVSLHQEVRMVKTSCSEREINLCLVSSRNTEWPESRQETFSICIVTCLDGRRWNELRHHSYETSIQPTAAGSSLVSQGNTTILCTVNGPMEASSSKGRAQYDRATINVEFTIGPFSTLERKKRSKNERYRLNTQVLTIDGYRRLVWH